MVSTSIQKNAESQHNNNKIKKLQEAFTQKRKTRMTIVKSTKGGSHAHINHKEA